MTNNLEISSTRFKSHNDTVETHADCLAKRIEQLEGLNNALDSSLFIGSLVAFIEGPKLRSVLVSILALFANDNKWKKVKNCLVKE